MELHVETMQIEGAAPYEIDESGQVFRRNPQGALKPLKRKKIGSKWYITIRKNDGVSWTFNTEQLARSMFHGSEKVYRPEHIYDMYDVRDIDDWDRYVITSYGAIYCIDPPKRGPNSGSCYRVRSFVVKGHSYVTLYRGSDERKNLRVRTLVEDTWGEDSTLPEL